MLDSNTTENDTPDTETNPVSAPEPKPKAARKKPHKPKLTVWYRPDQDGWISRNQPGEAFAFQNVFQVLAYLQHIGMKAAPDAVRDKTRTQIPFFMGGYRTEPGQEGMIKGIETLKIDLLVLDFDHNVTMSIDELIGRLPWDAAVWTTRSDKPDERHYRIVIRLDRPVSDKEEFKALMAAVNDHLGGGVHLQSGINKIQDCPTRTSDTRYTEDQPPLPVDQLVGTTVRMGNIDLQVPPAVETKPVPPTRPEATPGPSLAAMEDHVLNILNRAVTAMVGREKGDRNDQYARHAFTIGGAVQALLDAGYDQDPEDFISILVETVDTLPDCDSASMDRHRETIRRSFREGRAKPFEDLGQDDSDFAAENTEPEENVQPVLRLKAAGKPSDNPRQDFSGSQYLTEDEWVHFGLFTEDEISYMKGQNWDYGGNAPMILQKIHEQRIAAQEELAERVEVKPDFVPLDDGINYDMEFPVEALPPTVRDAMLALMHSSKVPAETAITCILGPIFTAAARRYNVDPVVFDKAIPVTNYCCNIAPSGGLKSFIFSQTTKGINRWIIEDQARYDVDFDKWKKAERAYNDALKKPAEHADLVKPIPAMDNDFIIDSGTTNGIQDKLKQCPVVGILTPEGGKLLHGHSTRDGSSQLIEWAAVVTSLWEGETIKKLTAVERLSLPDRAASMMMLVQGGPVAAFMNNETLQQQGIHNRMLISQSPPQKKKSLVETAEERKENPLAAVRRTEALRRYNDRIYDMLAMGPAVKAGTCRRDPITVGWADDSYLVLAQWQDEVEQKISTLYQPVAGFATRLFEHGCRLAAALALFEGQTQISPKIAASAQRIMEWYLIHRFKVLDAIPAAFNRDTEVFVMAFTVLKKLRHRHLVKGEPEWAFRTIRDLVVQGTFKGWGRKKQQEVMATCCELEWLTKRTEKASNGKTLEIYSLTRKGLEEAGGSD